MMRVTGPNARQKNVARCMQAATLFIFAAFLAPTEVHADRILPSESPNPASAQQPNNGPYTVYAQTAHDNSLNFPVDTGPATTVIQNALNAQYTTAGQQAIYGSPGGPVVTQGALYGTLQNPVTWNIIQYGAVAGDYAGAGMILQASGLPADEHWLQLVHLSYLPQGTNRDWPASATWADPSGQGYWLVDNNFVDKNDPTQPFYDQAGYNNFAYPSFNDLAAGPWDGKSFFWGYLFAAEMDAQ